MPYYIKLVIRTMKFQTGFLLSGYDTGVVEIRSNSFFTS